MTPDLYWIPGPWKGHLAISRRPRGGEWLQDEIRGWRNAGVDTVVSLLEKDEERELELRDEQRLAEELGIRFLSLPTSDRGVPASLHSTVSLLSEVNSALGGGKNVAVHCRQGIGRSSLVAAGALMSAGFSPEDAIRTVSLARGLDIPETPEQRSWLTKELAGSLAPVHH